MTPIVNLLAFGLDFDVVDAFGFIPGCAQYSRIEPDVRIEVVFLGETFEVLSQVN